MAFSESDMEGETDLPFLPDGPGTPDGQGAPGTRGITAVAAGVRPDRVFCRELAEVFLGLVSALEAFAERSSQCVLEAGVNTKYDGWTYICHCQEFQKDGTGFPSLNSETG